MKSEKVNKLLSKINLSIGLILEELDNIKKSLINEEKEAK
jgi:hypothetical protein